MAEQGMLLVISGPSGTGKGTLAAKLLETDPSFFFSVSATTRKPRAHEVHGQHYFFLSEAEFAQKLSEDAFLEHAQVHGHCYGTLKEHVLAQMEKGMNVLLDIDPQGAKAIMKAMPDCVSVFILPPSYEELARRLVTRNTEDPVEIKRRLSNARGEIEQMGKYRYALVNDSLDTAFADLAAIVRAEKRNTKRYHPPIPEGGMSYGHDQTLDH